MAIYMSFYEFDHIFDVKKIEDNIEWAERDIQKCVEAISKHQEYIKNMKKHIGVIQNTEFKYVVLLDRLKDYSTNRISFTVCLAEKPITDKTHRNGNPIYGKFSHQERFEGKERHLALAYASKLKREFDCELIEKGFKNR